MNATFETLEKIDKCAYCDNIAQYLWRKTKKNILSLKVSAKLVCNDHRLEHVLDK